MTEGNCQLPTFSLFSGDLVYLPAYTPILTLIRFHSASIGILNTVSLTVF